MSRRLDRHRVGEPARGGRLRSGPPAVRGGRAVTGSTPTARRRRRIPGSGARSRRTGRDGGRRPTGDRRRRRGRRGVRRGGPASAGEGVSVMGPRDLGRGGSQRSTGSLETGESSPRLMTVGRRPRDGPLSPNQCRTMPPVTFPHPRAPPYTATCAARRIRRRRPPGWPVGPPCGGSGRRAPPARCRRRWRPSRPAARPARAEPVSSAWRSMQPAQLLEELGVGPGGLDQGGVEPAGQLAVGVPDEGLAAGHARAQVVADRPEDDDACRRSCTRRRGRPRPRPRPMAPELRTAKRSPADPATNSSPPVAP